MSGITWIKLAIDMFNDEKIRLIRTLPEGDSILLIWIQLLCLAGKTNDKGSVYIGQNIYYTDEMLSTICNEPIGVVRIALETFKNFGLIDITDKGLILIENWEKHQNIDGMERAKIKTKERVRKHRERQKAITQGKKENKQIPEEDDEEEEEEKQSSSEVNTSNTEENDINKSESELHENSKCNVTVTLRNTDVTEQNKNKNKNKNKNIDIDKDIRDIDIYDEDITGGYPPHHNINNNIYNKNKDKELSTISEELSTKLCTSNKDLSTTRSKALIDDEEDRLKIKNLTPEEQAVFNYYYKQVKNNTSNKDYLDVVNGLKAYGWQRVLYTLVYLKDEKNIKTTSFKYVDTTIKNQKDIDPFLIDVIAENTIKNLKTKQ